jgi:pimeloyl-ACP methyl ester carboxylesterase
MDIERGDVILHVRDIGSGTPVVLLHGWPDTGDLWRNQVPALTASGFRVIAPDLRGFGRSSKPIDLAAYARRSWSVTSSACSTRWASTVPISSATTGVRPSPG